MAIYTQYHVTCNNGHTTTGDNSITHCATCGQKVAMGWKVRTERKSDLTQEQRLARLLQWMSDHESTARYEWCLELQDADQSSPGETVLVADWNNIPHGVSDYAEAQCGATPGFGDEYSICECGKAIRTTPGYYGDEGNYFVGDGYILCRECLSDSPDDMIEECLNSTDRAIKPWAKPLIANAGFECLELDESCPNRATGFHPGQNDTPQGALQEIYDSVGEQWFHDNWDYLFVINDVGQFDCHWSIWGRRKEQEGD